jgi:nucleotide-binding universal stress UspA family protein
VFERILVAFDGMPPSRQACRVALELASKFASRVTLATVHSLSSGPTDGHLESLVPVDAEGRSIAVLVEGLKADAARRGVPSLEHVSLQGEVVPSLISYLRDHPHDLLITGSRGLSRGRRLLLGSVSSGLADQAPCPVLVLRPEPAVPEGVSRPARKKGA